jgi:hypothetical protein
MNYFQFQAWLEILKSLDYAKRLELRLLSSAVKSNVNLSGLDLTVFEDKDTDTKSCDVVSG